MPLNIRPKQGCKWDLVALGEVMLRLDPGDRPVSTARRFDVWEGGGEYNVARGLKRCFGLDTAVASAFADNAVGRLIQDLIYQGGVDQSLVQWVPYDGVGRSVRNGLNFTERGFGLRAPAGCSDRGHTAASQMKPGEIDWDDVFGAKGARWLHTGGIFCALSETTPLVAIEAMEAAKRHGVVVSYDFNYRPSLWKANAGAARVRELNRQIASLVDVMIGSEYDFSAALGFEIPHADESPADCGTYAFKKVVEAVLKEFPFSVVATTLRTTKSASCHDWGAICYCDGNFYEATRREGIELYDRVGGGDAFDSGLFYGLMSGQPIEWCVECGAAHGALAMTTPGDTTMATLSDVVALMSGVGARIAR